MAHGGSDERKGAWLRVRDPPEAMCRQGGCEEAME